MSVRILALVWDHYRGGGSELLALLALADWSDDDGRCYPSMTAIAEKTRLSRSQAQRVVHALIDAGDVVVIGNANGGAPGASRRYRIVLERLTGRINAAPTGRMHATGRADATGRTDAQDGSHGCAETGRTGATLTVKEPSITVIPSSAKPPISPACPHDELIALFGKHLPSLPQPRPELWQGQRAKDMTARWRWVLTAKRSDGSRYASDREEALAWFGRFFATVGESDFLTGRSGAWAGCDLGWLMREANFAKVVQGNYTNRDTA